MKEQILNLVLEAMKAAGIEASDEVKAKISINVPDNKLGDYATNAALILANGAGTKPMDLADKIAGKIDSTKVQAVVAAPGFINFKIPDGILVKEVFTHERKPSSKKEDKILLEYFQPNIAKPLHLGHLRTAIIGDALKRQMKYAGYMVESDTHMGDWGTQFGQLILAYKKYGDADAIMKDPILELNKLYIRIHEEIGKDKSVHEAAKQEFVKLEQGDKENKKLWKKFVDWSMGKFENFEKIFDLEKFEHNWPESFYEDKMPAVLDELREKGLLVESQGAQIVNLEGEKLGVAVIVKSDGGTTYLLRDLATFIFCTNQGFVRHLYVVDNRQSHHYRQLFAILKLMGKMADNEGVHIDYGFISFKGQALSTRKGNMVLAEDVLDEARKRVVKIIKEKNPGLADKEKVIRAVSIGAIKYFDLSHNRRSDYEFDWDEALDFEGNSGPYVQYAYARLCGILSKVNLQGSHKLEIESIRPVEHELMVRLLSLEDTVNDALKDYMPNLLANYAYDLAALINKFYHESPVSQEPDEKLKYFRFNLIKKAKEVLGVALNLLGIEALEEM